MGADQLTETGPSRVDWLCRASREVATALCSAAHVADPAGVHCARFALHLVQRVPLPEGYAHEVLHAPEYRKGRNWYVAPLEAHVCTMAMYAADADTAVGDLAEFCSGENFGLEQAAIFHFARSPAVLDDERLLELSASEHDEVRRAVAQLLGSRESPCRKEILIRLMDDPARRVSQAASWTAGHIGDRDLADLLVSRGNLFALSFVGDPRARPRVEFLVNSDDPLDGEEAVATAHALGDRRLISRLWEKRDWYTRSMAILGSVREGVLDDVELDGILSRQSAEHLAELALRWPPTQAAGLVRLARLLCEPAGVLPASDALTEGRHDALDRVRTCISSAPTFGGAALRLLPEPAATSLAAELIRSPDPGVRIVAAQAIRYRRLTAGYALVAQMCLDPDEAVAKAAAREVSFGRMRPGVYGLDTAVLRAGGNAGAGLEARLDLRRLVEAILVGDA